jgi:hypothetical protein
MITDEEIEQLAEDPELAFVQFEEIVRGRSNEKIEQAERSENGDASIYYLEYINKVLAAARAFKIDALKDCELPPVDGNCWQAYRRFVHAVDFATTQIRITHAGRNRNNSVGLDGNTKAKFTAISRKSESFSTKPSFQR